METQENKYIKIKSEKQRYIFCENSLLKKGVSPQALLIIRKILNMMAKNKILSMQYIENYKYLNYIKFNIKDILKEEEEKDIGKYLKELLRISFYSTIREIKSGSLKFTTIFPFLEYEYEEGKEEFSININAKFLKKYLKKGRYIKSNSYDITVKAQEENKIKPLHYWVSVKEMEHPPIVNRTENSATSKVVLVQLFHGNICMGIYEEKLGWLINSQERVVAWMDYGKYEEEK